MTKPLVILGSARRDGYTRRAVSMAFQDREIELIDLSTHQIGVYDYSHLHQGDDFLSIVERMTQTKKIIFATPVYWYAMSGAMKDFFDRLTDLLEIAKDTGRQLAGRDVWLLATGAERELPRGFEIPFLGTAAYFGMNYLSAGYLYTGPDRMEQDQSESDLALFGRRVLEH
jgi:multimeric flavodoxin WrbA